MPDSKMENTKPEFLFVDQLLKAAIKMHIEIDGQWEIEKALFEDEWEAQRLAPEVEEACGLQVSDANIDVDFSQDDDIESLTNCYVNFDATGKLAAVFRAHGLRTQIEIDVFNSAIGSGVALLSDEDVDDQVSLLNLWVEYPAKLGGLMESLKDSFGSLA